jgi:hypothetical protein
MAAFGGVVEVGLARRDAGQEMGVLPAQSLAGPGLCSRPDRASPAVTYGSFPVCEIAAVRLLSAGGWRLALLARSDQSRQ